jgi:hypothetical protein
LVNGPADLASPGSSGDVETAELVDSSYMTRATYNLGANDLTYLEKRRNSEDYTDLGRILGQGAGCPAKGRFFLEYIKPCHNVERLNAGWLKSVYVRFKSRLQII